MTIDQAAALVGRVKYIEPRIQCDIRNVADTEDYYRFDVALWFPGAGSAQTIEEYPVTGLVALLEQVTGSAIGGRE